ncbi:MAG: hypothetical protein ACR2K2_05205 [Mycobacteriales bacterium]
MTDDAALDADIRAIRDEYVVPSWLPLAAIRPRSPRSIEMLLYAAKIMRSTRTGNPTLVFITDRNHRQPELGVPRSRCPRYCPEASRTASLAKIAGASSCASSRRLAQRSFVPSFIEATNLYLPRLFG